MIHKTGESKICQLLIPMFCDFVRITDVFFDLSHFYNIKNVDVLNRKIGAGRSVQSNFLNSVTHIAVLRTSFVKTNTLHRVTTKTPNLLRR